MKCSIALSIAVFFSSFVFAAEQPEGDLPLGANGKPLNLDFETGDLRDWQAQGTAFKGQPIKGDTVHPRRPDSKSQHQGQYWIGGYEKLKDPPKGTLTSAPFKVTQPWASFLVGGGPHALQTCVEIVQKDNQKVLYRIAGRERENMERALVDLRKHQGKEIFIRLVDSHTGHWGHVNFDDFRFYKEKPKFPVRGPARTVADLFAYRNLTAEKAAEVMTLPNGFHVIPCASEPEVRQPIAMTFDDRGRLWVAEAYAYPRKVPKNEAKDRILIFEDTTGDGKLDKRAIFIEGLNLVSGLEVGFGGVWVGQAPELLFIPDRNNDNKPDGPPEVVLDGWGYQDTHETLNSFIWGPDGWLYGCHGVFTHSLVGKPGAPKEERVPINAGIWRYHPLKKKFEVFAWGTSNPWGVDFNDKGHCFLTCCVIPHLFHVIQGARYRRQAGAHFQPHTYAAIQTIAQHRHFVGNQWNNTDRARSDSVGGGHAHAGAMVYLGDTWPKKYRNQLFMNNIHGARLNVDRLTPNGSGYIGNGEPDFCLTNDLWSQIIYLRYGPDGNVTMIDWYDRNQCHHRRVGDHDRSNGRIFKIVYGKHKLIKVNLADKTDRELVALQTHPNDWYVRHARRLLMERAAAKKLDKEVVDLLTKMAFEQKDITHRLRALWALHVTQGLTETLIQKALTDGDLDFRSWAVQLACESGSPSKAILQRLEAMAKDSSPVVRLALSSAVQRLEPKDRWGILKGLLSHNDDKDHNLPLMVWYGLESLVEEDLPKALTLGLEGKIDPVRRFMVRRAVTQGSPATLTTLLAAVLATEDVDRQALILNGIQTGLQGRREVEMPNLWKKVFDKLGDSRTEAIRTVVWGLAVKFGDPTVQDRMRQLLGKSTTPLTQRQKFLESLVAARDKKAIPVLHKLLATPDLRAEALRALAAFESSETPAAILKRYSSLNGIEKRAALSTLVSRKNYALPLLQAIGTKLVPATDLTADLVRQLRNLKSQEIDKAIAAHWGTVRQTAADKAKMIAEYKKLLARRPRGPNLLPLGRAVFAKTCAQCHTLFGTGGKVGPDLTGSNRADLDYLLSNVVDPSAVLGKDYVSSVIDTTKGRTITGLIRNQDKDSITVVTADQELILPRSEIEEIRSSKQSMMPEDLLKPLSQREVQALVTYLGSPRQVPLLATKDNTQLLFNGKDLTGWTGSKEHWKVENGEIVGIRKKAKVNRNEFLISDLVVTDFRLTFQVKLTPNQGNSGVQFRSQVLPGGDVKGYQADIGKGWWGKLYEEHGRALLWKKSGENHVKAGQWNHYKIEAIGPRIRTWINGNLCVDLTDPIGRQSGILALQVHSGEPFEVRFKDLKLEVLNKK